MWQLSMSSGLGEVSTERKRHAADRYGRCPLKAALAPVAGRSFAGPALRAASSALYSSSVKSYQPIQEKPISSMVRPVPAPTQFFGSGLNLLLVVLSHQLMTCSIVPAGTIGATLGS